MSEHKNLKEPRAARGLREVPRQMGRKRIYVRQRMDAWGSIKIPAINGELPLSGEGIGSCGMLICFPTLKAFKAQHPKEKPLILVKA